MDKCLHIVQAFKLFCRSIFGHLHPLVHPNKGLTHCTLLHYSQEQGHSVKLTIVIQDIMNYKFLWFPKLEDSLENVAQCQMDLLRFLGFDIEQQNPLVEKIKEFMCKTAQKTILNLVSHGMMQELIDMWCNLLVGLDDQPHDRIKMVIRFFLHLTCKGLLSMTAVV